MPSTVRRSHGGAVTLIQERAVHLRTARVTAAQLLADKDDLLRGRVRLLTQRIEGIEREAGQVMLRHADLHRRFGLVAKVPCVGTDLQRRRKLPGDCERLSAERDASMGRIVASAAALPPAFDSNRRELARRASVPAEARLRSAEQAHLAAVRIQERRAALQAQHARVSAEVAESNTRATEVESQLSGWTLLAKWLGNDGVIALDFDDAGPRLASLANDLLLACYGRRFTLEIRTQVATAKGEMREGFDIAVHDGETGESKASPC